MRYTVIEYKFGPDKDDGIRHCIRCGGEIEAHTQWIKVWAPDGAYCVGVCDSCAAHTVARSLPEPTFIVRAVRPTVAAARG